MQKKKTAHHGRICSWQRLWSRVLVLILLAATMISVLQPQRAQAVEVNGQAGGSIPGASNTNVTGGYAIRSTTIPLGFRFTVVTESGAIVKDPKDIFANSQLSDMISGGYKTYGILDVKRCKITYKDIYKSSSTKYNYTNVTLSSASGIASSSAGRYLDTNLGLTLPTSASSMVNTWSQYEENIDKVLEALWSMDITSDWAANDYHLAVEPLYAVKIGGQYFPLTVTEAVIYSVLDSTAYSTANGRWDGTTAGLWTAVPDYTSDNGTTWQTISGYTHGAWPESMKLEEAVFGLSDPSTTLSTSSRGSAKNIIEKGYGIIDVSKEYFPSISTPTTYTNTIAFYAGEFKNQEGNSSSGNWLSLGSTTFTADAGSSVTMNSSRSISAPNGHYLASTFGTSGLAGSWTRYTMPYTFTQPSKNLWLEYDFIANEYKITYNLNGGTNNSANPSTYNVHYGVSLKNPTRTD